MNTTMRMTGTLLSGWILLLTPSIVAATGTAAAGAGWLRFTVVFNNVPYKPGLKTGWGFACLVQGVDKTVLFDTGGDGDILLSNMRQLGLDAKAVDAVFLSHLHADHTGGLGAFLARNPAATVYLPEPLPQSLQQQVGRLGAVTETVSGPQRLFSNVYSTGPLGTDIKEQALIVDTSQGLILVTGCAHANVVAMAEHAHAYLGKNIYLLMGGFHLGGSSPAEIRSIVARLRALGVERVAPSHCTGHNAIRMFRDTWKNDFIEGGLGAVIEVPK